MFFVCFECTLSQSNHSLGVVLRHMRGHSLRAQTANIIFKFAKSKPSMGIYSNYKVPVNTHRCTSQRQVWVEYKTFIHRNDLSCTNRMKPTSWRCGVGWMTNFIKFYSCFCIALKYFCASSASSYCLQQLMFFFYISIEVPKIDGLNYSELHCIMDNRSILPVGSGSISRPTTCTQYCNHCT